MKLVLYVSHKTNPWPSDAEDVDDITTLALSRNAALRVTGVLISTDFYFTQILEGPSAAVDEVMGSTVVNYARDTSLESILSNKAYRIDAAHLYADTIYRGIAEELARRLLQRNAVTGVPHIVGRSPTDRSRHSIGVRI